MSDKEIGEYKSKKLEYKGKKWESSSQKLEIFFNIDKTLACIQVWEKEPADWENVKIERGDN